MRHTSHRLQFSGTWLAVLGLCLCIAAPSLAGEIVSAEVINVTSVGEVSLALPPGAAVAAGDPVRIGAELVGVGKVDIATPWRIESVSGSEAKAVPEGPPSAMPQAGYLATISTEMAQNPVEGDNTAGTAVGNGLDSLAPDDPVAVFQVTLRAAEAGQGPEMISLAEMYLDGEGTAPNPAEAWRWLQAALATGERDAHAGLGAMLLDGTAPYDDPAEAARHLFEAFEDASPGSAAYAVNVMVNDGPDAPLAFRTEVQNILSQIGVYSGPIDGVFGPETLDAIEMLRQERFGAP